MNPSLQASGAIALAYLLTSVVAIAEPARTSSTLEQQVEEVAALLSGKMDTSAQAIANSKAPNVQMTTCRIELLPLADSQSIFYIKNRQCPRLLISHIVSDFCKFRPIRSAKVCDRAPSSQLTQLAGLDCAIPVGILLGRRFTNILQIAKPFCGNPSTLAIWALLFATSSSNKLARAT